MSGSAPPRPPRLSYVVELVALEPGAGLGRYECVAAGPMSEEKRRFLEGALKAMGEDGAERQRAILKPCRSSSTARATRTRVDALEPWRTTPRTSTRRATC